MSGCSQHGVTNSAFARLASARCLLMKGCTQATITDAAFAPLRGGALHHLDVDGCKQLAAAALDGLDGLRAVSAALCRAPLRARAEAITRAHAAPRGAPKR